MKKRMRLVGVLAVLLLCLSIPQWGMAQEATDIFDAFTISGMKLRENDRMHDQKMNTGCSTKPYNKLGFEAQSETEKCYGLYILFNEAPKSWRIETKDGFKWHTAYEGNADMLHVYVPLDGTQHFRMTKDDLETYIIKEMYLLSEGEVPSWVQQWKYTAPDERPDKADIMVLSGHPDDEWLFMGGTIPYYTMEKEKNVVVVYATCGTPVRASELLNGLWQSGVRNYPVIGTFRDGFSKSLEKGYSIWNKKKFNHFLAEQIRRYRPDVMVTHDVNGEYGHGAHMVCADASQYIVEQTNDATYAPESVEKWGTWQVQKLYLHLFEENPIHMDWRIPMKNGATPFEIAEKGYACHVSQHDAGTAVGDGEKFAVKDTGDLSCSEFGLAFTTVGVDVAKNDFLENVVPQEVPEEPIKAIELTVKAQPITDAQGYMISGEYTEINEAEGKWVYLSTDLQVRIIRYHDRVAKTTWYEANIHCKTEDGVKLATYPSVVGKRGTHAVQPDEIAKLHQLIFACTTDYFTYRTGGIRADGIVIRGGELLCNETYPSGTKKFPTLDTGALYADGRFMVYQSSDVQAEQYIEMGATDVFCFGPYLIKEGEVNPLLKDWSLGKTPQPRMGMGMVSPGHYVVIMEEGRFDKEAIGTSLYTLALKLQEAGVVEGLNLDGGQTAAMCFMGERITRVASYSNNRTYPRDTTEVLGVGVYSVSE